jgi:hypothetical protein
VNRNTKQLTDTFFLEFIFVCILAILIFQIGRTEHIKNCHDPKFTTPFTVEYFFEEIQKVKIEVYDLDNQTSKLTDDDFLGKTECNLAQVCISAFIEYSYGPQI